jgi:hypothetical protein
VGDKNYELVYFKNMVKKPQSTRVPDPIVIRTSGLHGSEWSHPDDSILSNHGYHADGSVDTLNRRHIISYIVGINKNNYQEVHNLLCGFIHFRSDRNPNAAEIWQNDLEWLEEKYGSNN